jgi:hypothetical protein
LVFLKILWKGLAASFKFEPLIKFCNKFEISLIHSTPYYTQGNGLVYSSKKCLIKLIKRLLEDNKKAWDSKLKFSLWDDQVTTKRALGTSPFKLMYRKKVVFPSQLALPVAKFFQDYQGEPDNMIRRIHQLVEAQQIRERVMDKAHDCQQRIKRAFDRKRRREDFQLGDLVLKWDAPRHDRGKHNKFEALWIGPFKISKVFSNNTYRLQDLEGEEVSNGLVNGHFLKKFFS